MKLSMKNFPLVFIDRNLSGIKASFVHSDNYPAAYDLTSYLIENGHADIGLISLKSSNVSTIQERIAGHCDALSNHGLIINKKQILTELENYDSQWEEKITAFLTNNPELTAVIALNYDLSVKTYTVLKKMGKKVPGDISVASYDNLLDDETELWKSSRLACISLPRISAQTPPRRSYGSYRIPNGSPRISRSLCG